MLHFSCDLCGTTLNPASGPRFVLKMESYPADNPSELTDAGTETDAVEEMAELLREAEEAGDELPAPATNRSFRFDLCPNCHRKVVANPLGRANSAAVRFSGN